MLVHIVYAHPSRESFTHAVLEAFVAGLDEAGHEHTVSDLYAMGFRPELTLAEYEREHGHRAETAIPADVAAEQARLAAADVWAFVYPVWWADCPAILKGWFDRVWTVGFAYYPQTVRPARKALVLATAGHTVEHLKAVGEYQAMRTVMLGDRVHDRAETKEFHLFDGSEDLAGGDWEAKKAEHLAAARRLARQA
jgi:NAD(P)H dehydrogenase (quinone)